MKDDLIVSAVEANVFGAIHFRNFWVARKEDEETGDLSEPFILEWNVTGHDKPDGQTIAAWVALLPPPDPQHKTQFSSIVFRDRFTLDEQIAIRQAQLTDMEVGLVYDAFISADYIDVTDSRVEQGIDLYIAKGLLEPDRKPALLEPELIPPAA